MKWSIAGLIAIGAVAALCASILALGLKSGPSGDNGAGAPAQDEVRILVAKEDLEKMTIVEADDFETKTIRRQHANRNYLTDPVQVIGRLLVVPLVKGEAFTRANFAEEGSGQRFASILPEGMRAVNVLLSGDAALSGVLYKGCRVDVLATPNSRAGSRPQTLLEYVEVLGIDGTTIVSEEEDEDSQKPAQGGRGRHMVTLLVNADQAIDLQAAVQSSAISLTLRNPLDKAQTKDRIADAVPEQVIEEPQQATTTAPAPELVEKQDDWTVMVITGTAVERVKFPRP